jgi:hypothetical protein
MRLIDEMVLRAPPFHGDLELAKKLGEMSADLLSALEDSK